MLGTDLGPWYVFRVSRGPRNAPQKDIVFARCSPFASQGKGMRAEEHGGDNLVLGVSAAMWVERGSQRPGALA